MDDPGLPAICLEGFLELEWTSCLEVDGTLDAPLVYLIEDSSGPAKVFFVNKKVTRLFTS